MKWFQEVIKRSITFDQGTVKAGHPYNQRIKKYKPLYNIGLQFYFLLS